MKVYKKSQKLRHVSIKTLAPSLFGINEGVFARALNLNKKSFKVTTLSFGQTRQKGSQNILAVLFLSMQAKQKVYKIVCLHCSSRRSERKSEVFLKQEKLHWSLVECLQWTAVKNALLGRIKFTTPIISIICTIYSHLITIVANTWASIVLQRCIIQGTYHLISKNFLHAF